MEEKRLYTITEAAAKAGISTTTMYKWLKSGKVEEPGRTKSGRRRFTEEDIKKISEPTASKT